jgi:hypothetical protein
MISIISMLSSPNDESPANIDAAKEWRENQVCNCGDASWENGSWPQVAASSGIVCWHCHAGFPACVQLLPSPLHASCLPLTQDVFKKKVARIVRKSQECL